MLSTLIHALRTGVADLADAAARQGWSPGRLVPLLADAVPEGSRVLDLGGLGTPTARTGLLGGYEVTTLHPSALRGPSPGVARLVLDHPCAPLPFPDGAFDAVLCDGTFLAAASAEFLAQECRRVLRPSGVLLLSTLTPPSRPADPSSLLRLALTEPRSALLLSSLLLTHDGAARPWWSEAAARRCLDAAGFTVEEVVTSTGGPGHMFVRARNRAVLVRAFWARSMEDFEACLRIRYQVYCLERGWEPSENFPDGMEHDEHDDSSIHFLCVDGDRNPVGTVRLVSDVGRGFPMEHHATLFPGVELPHRDRVAEFSRLACPKEHLFHFRYERGPDRHPLEALLRACYHVSRQIGIAHWCAVLEERLRRLLEGRGFPLIPIGPPVELRGERVPCLAHMEEVEEALARRNFYLLRTFTTGLDKPNLLAVLGRYRKVLFAPREDSLASVMACTRAARELARRVDGMGNVRFEPVVAASGPATTLVNRASLRSVPVFGPSPDQTARPGAAAVGRQLRSELSLLRAEDPELVVGHDRPTLRTACELLGLPYVALMDAPPPRDDSLLDGFRDALAARPYDALRVRLGLPPLRSLRRHLSSPRRNLLVGWAGLRDGDPLPATWTAIGHARLFLTDEYIERRGPEARPLAPAPSAPFAYVVALSPLALRPLRLCLAAAPEFDGVGLVAAVDDPAWLDGPPPLDVVVDAGLPRRERLEAAAVLVCDGSAAVVGEALSAGVPVLGVTSTDDDRARMRRVEALGLGVGLDAVDARPRRLAALVRRLSRDEGARARLAGVRTELDVDAASLMADLVDELASASAPAPR